MITMQRSNSAGSHMIGILLILILVSCGADPDTRHEEEEIVDPQVTNFIKSFEGRGDLTDDSNPTAPSEAIGQFKHPDDLEIDLVLAEPEIFQPVEIKFDHRGRLWVVQYSQYPYPQGLKVTSVDHHLRTQFDKIPEAPPLGEPGADKITFFEDTDGDGIFDKATDAISGLNIATSVLLGRGKIWVLNPPYLLAYPDSDGDGLPNGDPEVHLKGFGLEDTHAVANSLTWGPDGWLYGAQGSTTTARINSENSKNVEFQGQAIWRYHPESKIFEIFAEGGGNTFDVEIDAKGRIYSGDNGTDRGQYYKQGAYYVKNWGKHGPHTNPYSYGYLANMALQGDRKRFTHAWIKNEGAALPEKYNNKMLAINPLQSYIQLTRLEENGSTFKNIDEERILETPDPWFRPVDIKAGPDGAVYIADWYDSRLSHVDPRDTWHKKSGRVYRLRSAQQTVKNTVGDLDKWTENELVEGLSSPNKWTRQQIQRILGDRKDLHYIPLLKPLLEEPNGQTNLEALWAIHSSGGFDEAFSIHNLRHRDPFVRMWTIRLIGDTRQLTRAQLEALKGLSKTEKHPEVRSQLAATAKRLEPLAALEIIGHLMQRNEDADDPDIPLQIWWAVEAKLGIYPEGMPLLFSDPAIWKSALAQRTVLSRIGQRFMAESNMSGFSALKDLLQKAPSHQLAKPLITGILEGLGGRDLKLLPQDLYRVIQSFGDVMGEGALAMDIRNGEPNSMQKALEIIQDPASDMQERLSYVKLFSEINYQAAIETLLAILDNQKTPVSLKKASLLTLKNYAEDEIGMRIANAYPDKLRADPTVRLSALSLLVSRPVWTQKLLELVADTRQIHKEDIPSYLVMQMSLSNNEIIKNKIKRIWPELQDSDETKNEDQYNKVLSILANGKGNPTSGRHIFETRCSSCHRLGNMGEDLGPDLSGYDRTNQKDLLYNIIFPNADIREGFVNYLIETKDKKTIIGNIQSNQGGIVQLKSSTGEMMTLADEKIEKIEPIDRSLMPENLLINLSPEEIRNLFSFLSQEP